MLLPDGPERDRILGGPKNRAKVDAYIDDLVAKAPPLTAGQKARLRVLLQRRPGAPEAPPTPAPAAEAPLLAQEEKARLRVPLRRAGPPETTPASTPTTQAAA